MVTLWFVQPSAPITGSAVADWRLIAKVTHRGPKSDEFAPQEARAW